MSARVIVGNLAWLGAYTFVTVLLYRADHHVAAGVFAVLVVETANWPSSRRR